MEKKFYWLRSVASVTSCLLAAYLLMILFRFHYFISSNTIVTGIVNILILCILFSHGIAIFYILRHNYPDKEISRPMRIFFQAVSFLTWICTLFIFIGLIGIVISMNDVQATNELSRQSSNDPPFLKIFIGFLLILAILLVVQLICANRLVSTINKNFKNRLFDTFS